MYSIYVYLHGYINRHVFGKLKNLNKRDCFCYITNKPKNNCFSDWFMI